MALSAGAVREGAGVDGWGCKEGEVDGETSHQPWPGRGGVLACIAERVRPDRHWRQCVFVYLRMCLCNSSMWMSIHVCVPVKCLHTWIHIHM